MCTYAQEVLAAIIHPEVAEEYRARPESILAAERNLLISVVALAGALGAATSGGEWPVSLLACGLIIVIMLTRGFSVLSRHGGDPQKRHDA